MSDLDTTLTTEAPAPEVCEWCDMPGSCRKLDECWRDGRSLFRMWEHEQKAATQ